MVSALFAIDTELAKARYAKLAEKYDHETRRMQPIRRRAIDALGLRKGDRVLDVACGTGKSFAPIRERIGDGGELIGVEPSRDMVQHAEVRIAAGGWDNVSIIEAPADTAKLSGTFDAVLFIYTQDVLQDAAALRNIFAHAAPGARVVSAGLKLFPWWMGLANVWLMARSYEYFTTWEGLSKPWANLAEYVPDLGVESTFFGSGYIATGHHRG